MLKVKSLESISLDAHMFFLKNTEFEKSVFS